MGKCSQSVERVCEGSRTMGKCSQSVGRVCEVVGGGRSCRGWAERGQPPRKRQSLSTLQLRTRGTENMKIIDSSLEGYHSKALVKLSKNM